MELVCTGATPVVAGIGEKGDASEVHERSAIS
jgi:hypothetical protein